MNKIKTHPIVAAIAPLLALLLNVILVLTLAAWRFDPRIFFAFSVV